MADNLEISHELRLPMTAWMIFKCAAMGLPNLITMDIWGQIHPSCGMHAYNPGPCNMFSSTARLYLPHASRSSTVTPQALPSCVVQRLCQMSPVKQTAPSHWRKEARLKRFVQRYESPGKTPEAHKGSVVFRGWCWDDHKKHGGVSRKCPRSWLCEWSHDYIKVCQSSQSCIQTQQIITK